MCVPSGTSPACHDAGSRTGDGGGEDERGVARVVDRDLEQRRLRLVEEFGDVDAREARRYEAEGGQGGVPPTVGSALKTR
jgi:hypothetical protein